jgi:tellurite resistance protein TerC
MLEALCSGGQSFWIWAVFIAFVFLLLLIDLGLFHKKTHEVGIKEALLWALVWFGLAMAFNVLVWLECGGDLGLQFFTGYLIEKSLSVDNLFVILLIFTSFSIPAIYQHRVLFWGILGALVMRGLLIALGAALIARFEWIFYVFGLFLLWTGGKMLFEKEGVFDPHKSWAVRMIHKIVPVKKLDGEKFFTKANGKFAVTILFVALVVVEFTDVVFAFDSIPAIFAITNDPFIVFTSNVFAILGLRSLYFVIAKAHDLFKHLKTGLAIILLFVGLKLLLKDFLHMSIFISLGVVLAILATSIAYSIIEKKMEDQAKGKKKKSKK